MAQRCSYRGSRKQTWREFGQKVFFEHNYQLANINFLQAIPSRRQENDTLHEVTKEKRSKILKMEKYIMHT